MKTPLHKKSREIERRAEEDEKTKTKLRKRGQEEEKEKEGGRIQRKNS
jgi:hypothetical protein